MVSGSVFVSIFVVIFHELLPSPPELGLFGHPGQNAQLDENRRRERFEESSIVRGSLFVKFFVAIVDELSSKSPSPLAVYQKCIS